MTDAAAPALAPGASLAARADSQSETPFQAYAHGLGLTFHACVPPPVPLEPVIAEMHALMASVPDGDRGHATSDGSWSDINLIFPTAAGAPETTPAYDACPAFQALLEAFGGPAGGAVLARIGPGELLDWHYDPVSADTEAVRLHLPIATDPQAVTDFCHERVHWPAGTLNYGDYGFPHRVLNTGETERIHLYFDVAAAPLLEHLPDALKAPRHALRQEAVSLWLNWRNTEGSAL